MCWIQPRNLLRPDSGKRSSQISSPCLMLVFKLTLSWKGRLGPEMAGPTLTKDSECGCCSFLKEQPRQRVLMSVTQLLYISIPGGLEDHILLKTYGQTMQNSHQEVILAVAHQKAIAGIVLVSAVFLSELQHRHCIVMEVLPRHHRNVGREASRFLHPSAFHSMQQSSMN